MGASPTPSNNNNTEHNSSNVSQAGTPMVDPRMDPPRPRSSLRCMQWSALLLIACSGTALLQLGGHSLAVGTTRPAADRPTREISTLPALASSHDHDEASVVETHDEASSSATILDYGRPAAAAQAPVHTLKHTTALPATTIVRTPKHTSAVSATTASPKAAGRRVPAEPSIATPASVCEQGGQTQKLCMSCLFQQVVAPHTHVIVKMNTEQDTFPQEYVQGKDVDLIASEQQFQPLVSALKAHAKGCDSAFRKRGLRVNMLFDSARSWQLRFQTGGDKLHYLVHVHSSEYFVNFGLALDVVQHVLDHAVLRQFGARFAQQRAHELIFSDRQCTKKHKCSAATKRYRDTAMTSSQST